MIYWVIASYIHRFQARDITQWTENTVKCVVIQCLKEMSQRRLAAICPLSQVFLNFFSQKNFMSSRLTLSFIIQKIVSVTSSLWSRILPMQNWVLKSDRISALNLGDGTLTFENKQVCILIFLILSFYQMSYWLQNDVSN